MPKGNGVCKQVWNELEKLYQPERVPSLSEVRKLAVERHWNANNAQAEYYAWRRQKGIFGRIGA